MLSEEQRKLRRTGIGGSDVAALVGLSRYRSALDVWLDKTGAEEGGGSEQVRPEVEWGNRLEGAVAQRYQDGHPEIMLRAWHTVQHSLAAWALATPDYLAIEPEPPGCWPVEIKTSDAWMRDEWGEAGTDDIPAEYLCQCQWYCVVLDKWRCDLAVLIGKSDYREYRIVREDALCEALWEAAERFWRDNVLANVPPPPGSSERAARALARLFPCDSPTVLSADADMDDLATQYFGARAAEESAARDKEGAENEIKARIGRASGVKGPWYFFGWRADKRGRRSFRATDTRNNDRSEP